MSYKKMNVQSMTESELRTMWAGTYCNAANPIYTFDDILVKFHIDMFDHAFYESSNRKRRDKSILSLNRCQKMLWIKETLQDPAAILKQGWDRDKKMYLKARRVAVVKNNYLVVIQILKEKEARFITAYEITETDNLSRILDGPDWIPYDFKTSNRP